MIRPVHIAYPCSPSPGIVWLSELPGTTVHVRGQVALVKQRHHTMSTVAATLAVSGHAIYASEGANDGRWMITIGAIPEGTQR
jgi:hypothetical protein